MKTVKHLFGFLLPVMFVAAVALSSCSGGASKEGGIIPKESLCVACVNIGSIWDKGEFDNLQDLTMIKELRKEIKNEGKQYVNIFDGILEDPSSTGIDMKGNMLFYVVPDGKYYYTFVYALTMKDKSVFEDFIKAIAKAAGDASDFAKPNVDSKNNISWYEAGSNEVIVYNDERILIISTTNYNIEEEDLKDYAVELLTLDSKNSITSDDNFNSYWKNRGDISVYATFDNLLSLAGNNREVKDALKMMPDDMNIDEIAMYYALSFENGSIQLKSETLGMSSSMKEVADQDFNKDLLKYMPEKTLAAGTIAINIEKFIEMYEDVDNVKDVLNQKIGIKNYKGRDVAEAFGGSIVASFYGMVDDKTPAIAVAADIKDPDIFKTIFNEAGFEKDGNIYTIKYSDYGYYLTDDAVVFSTDIKVLNKAKNGGYDNGLGDIADKAKNGNYFFVELNTKKYPAELLEELDHELFYNYYYDYYYDEYRHSVNEEDRDLFYEIVGWFKNIEIERQGDSAGVIKLNTADDSTNSLAYIIKNIDKLVSKYLK